MENSFNKKSTFFKLLSVAFVLCAFTWNALAQNVIVKGVVKDTDGQTVIGASVLQKGTLNGVTTDADGAFQLTVPSNATLQVSFIGYKTVEVAVNNRTSINVTLEEDRQMLEETVVIGYGTAKRSDVTGSISSVNQDVIRQIPAGNITAALQGRIAGVEMRQTSNSPGATMRIRIRGTRSLSASNDPLIVLDGIPFSGSLQDINTDDVKSIDILKDASSTAIYGSRGANGVIMITTEHGQQGQPARVSFNSYASYKQWIPYPFMNTQQYTTMRDLAKKYNDTPDEQRDLYDTDWQAIYYEPGYSIQNNLTVTGGTNGGHYSFGLGYYKDESNIPTEGFDRINVRASLDQGIGKYFTFGFSTNLGLNKNYGNAGGAQTDLTPMINPWIDPAKGNVAGNTRLEGLVMPKDNNYIAKTRALMYEVADKNVSITKRYSAYNSAYLEVEAPFLKGLKYRLNAGANIRLTEGGSYRGQGVLSNIPTNPASASRSHSNNTSWDLEHLLTFNRTFNDVHALSLTAMFSVEKTENYSGNYSINHAGAEYMQFYEMDYFEGTPTLSNHSYTDYGLMSWMGRVMYTYANKYMITAMVRGDGSSRLAEGRKWHTYPAVSVGWNISNEDFMDNVAWVDMLKIRAGYGQTSNQAISAYATLGQLSSYPYNMGSDYMLGYYVSALPNTNLGWEYSETWNFGLDYALLNNRINGTIEYYHVLTTDLLQNVALPPTAGVGSYTANVGKTKNNGIEFTINGTLVQHRGDGFNWNVGLNVSHNHNEIVELASGQTENRGNNWYVGYPVNSFRDYVYDGIFQPDEEDARKILEGSGNVGMIKVKYLGDYDANGLPTRPIGDEDKIIQSNEAILMGGFNTNMTWKGFDFNVVGGFQIGGIYTSNTHYSYTNQLSGRRGNLLVDYWTPETPNAHWPAPGGLAENDDSPIHQGCASRYSGTNIVINTITLGYNFANIKAVKNIGLRNCRLYATVQNPFVIYSPFMKATGIRPMTNGGAYAVGATGTPNSINYLLGINLSF